MKHKIYLKKEDENFNKKLQQFLKNCNFQIGNNVKLKGDINSPIMTIVGIIVKTVPNHTLGFQESSLEVYCKWFNKSRQDFSSTCLSSACLALV